MGLSSILLVIYTGVALDPYSSDGHDGIVREDGKFHRSIVEPSISVLNFDDGFTDVCQSSIFTNVLGKTLMETISRFCLSLCYICNQFVPQLTIWATI